MEYKLLRTFNYMHKKVKLNICLYINKNVKYLSRHVIICVISGRAYQN